MTPRGLRAFLYDADGRDREVTLDRALVGRLDEDDLLWVDVDTGVDGDLLAVTTELELPPHVLPASKEAEESPDVQEYSSWLVVSMNALHRADDRWQFDPLVCVVGHNWLVTAHPGPLSWLEAFDAHVRDDSALGKLDATSFLSQLSEWMIDAYLEALEDLQGEIDGIEESILRDETEETALERLVSLRRRVGFVRSRLSPHRRVFATLGHPNVGVHEAVGSPEAFAVVTERLELAMQAVETTREMIVGAFDLYMTQTAQHTNDIMKVLTTLSVLLLPTALLASILGMTNLPPVLDLDWVYWSSLAVMFSVSVVLLYLLRNSRWM